MDLISSNLQATNTKFNSILSGLESAKADALANLETAASTATSAISSQLASVTGDLRSLIPEGFSVPNVNLQGQLQSLSGLTDPTQSANLLASIKSDFGSALTAGGFDLDSLVSSAASAFGTDTSLSGLVPNFELSPSGDIIQKANAVKLPSIDPVIEEVSTFTENSDFAAAKTAAINAVYTTSETLPTADAGVYKVSDKSKKISQSSGGVVITKEVTTPDQAVEGDTRKNISSKGFSNRVVTHRDTFIEQLTKKKYWGPPGVGYWEDNGTFLKVTLNFEPTQIVGIKGLVSDDQREKHAKADGTIVNVNEFLIGESPLVKQAMPYEKDEFEVIGGTDGKVIYIYQTYRKYNKRVRVFYKYNETYDPNYAKT
jgi:hypothetical protein